MKKFWKFWLPVVLWMGVIFVFSAIPNLKTGFKEDFLLRKIAHMLEFAILTFLFIRALKQEEINFSKLLIFSIIFSFFYALIDEYHQSFVEGRQCSLKDISIDSIGILIASLMCYIKYKGRNH